METKKEWVEYKAENVLKSIAKDGYGCVCLDTTIYKGSHPFSQKFSDNRNKRELMYVWGKDGKWAEVCGKQGVERILGKFYDFLSEKADQIIEKANNDEDVELVNYWGNWVAKGSTIKGYFKDRKDIDIDNNTLYWYDNDGHIAEIADKGELIDLLSLQY